MSESSSTDSNHWERPATEEGFGLAFEEQRPFLRRVAGRGWNSTASPRIGASDLVQQTYLAARRYLDRFRGRTRAEWRAWLLLILRSQKTRATRGAGPSASPLPGSSWSDAPVDPDPWPSRWVTEQERRRVVREALDRLSEEDRRVLELRHRDQLRFRAIAEHFGGCTAEAARKRYARALDRLRVALGPVHDGF